MGDTKTTCVARVGTLSGFADETSSGEGVHLRDLGPMDVLLVRTRNSIYRIIIRSGSEVTVQGGAFFADPTRAVVDGSSFGGSLLKTGWVGLGLRLEIRAGGRRILTSAVRSIARQPPQSHVH